MGCVQEKVKGYKPDPLACSLSNPNKTMNRCSNDFICGRALNGGDWWATGHPLYNYAVEAKKRGLTCGIKSNTLLPKAATSLQCSFKHITDASICDDQVICTRATIGNTAKLWHRNNHSFYKYVVEAKKRGLFCGVGSSTSKPTLETKPPKINPIAPKKKQKKPFKYLVLLDNPLHFERYGKAFHTPLLPNVIFFIGEIEDGDEKGFRIALRNHKVDTVVLISDGGSANSGLELANIIYDNNLATFVPLKERCASACSFMFFAGSSKVAHGRLGVHQLSIEDDKKKVAVGTILKDSQYAVADIIRNLTDFGTPASVFSKMFSTSGMYFFSEEEKSAFSNNGISPKLINRINEVLVYLSKDLGNEFDDSVLNSMPAAMKNRLTQLELVRIGCMKGPVDGIKGEATTTAIKLFSSKIGSNMSAGKFSDLFRALNNTKVGVCY